VNEGGIITFFWAAELRPNESMEKLPPHKTPTYSNKEKPKAKTPKFLSIRAYFYVF